MTRHSGEITSTVCMGKKELIARRVVPAKRCDAERFGDVESGNPGRSRSMLGLDAEYDAIAVRSGPLACRHRRRNTSYRHLLLILLAPLYCQHQKKIFRRRLKRKVANCSHTGPITLLQDVSTSRAHRKGLPYGSINSQCRKQQRFSHRITDGERPCLF